MASKEYMAGFVIGLFVVLIIFIMIWKVSGKQALKENYDERQELIRGIGYKYAYFTCLALLLVYAIISAFAENFPFTPREAIFTVIIISVIVYALYCIRKDAFFGVEENGVRKNSRRYVALLWIVIALNLIAPASHILSGDSIVEDGYISTNIWTNALCVLAFGAVLIAIKVREAEYRREEQEDEES